MQHHPVKTGITFLLLEELKRADEILSGT